MPLPSWWDQDNRVPQLKELYEQELSSTQIARIMGCTRNSVIGKINRLKLNQNGKVKMRNIGGPTKSKKSAPLPALEAPIEPASVFGELVTEENIRRGMCRYPHGDPSTSAFHYCGHATKERSIYCAYHHSICYTPNVKKDGSR